MVNDLIAQVNMGYYHPMASLKASSVKSRLTASDFEPPEGLVAVAGFDSFDAAGDAGLSILAMGQPYWTFISEGDYILCVDAAQAEAVLRELAALAELKSASPVARRFHYLEFRVRPFSFLLYGVLLSFFFAGQSIFELVSAGRADAQLMVQGGEWWRAVTALTLHGDLVHLVSNIVAGLGFAFFVARFFGAAAGWLLILLSGFTGNILNAWVHYPAAHLSIGASTAVFGALGLLSGVGVWMALVDPRDAPGLPRWLIPLLAGLTLLGLLGVGDGVTVDVAAHLSGFVCGLFWGFGAAFFQRYFVRLEAHAFSLGLMGLVSVAGAWAFALL